MTDNKAEVLGTVLDALPSGVALVDATGRVVYTNRRLAELLGSVAAEWVGQPWEICFRLAAPGADSAGLADIELAGRILRRTRVPLDEGMGQLEIFDDVTEARQRDHVRDELTALMAHELRNPLTAMLGFAKLLKDRPDAPTDKRMRWATHIIDKSQTMADLISAIVDMSRLTAGRLRFKWDVVDLAPLVEQVADGVRARTGRPVQVVTVPARVKGDAARLTQLLQALLDNALKYAPADTSITIQLATRDRSATLSVADAGPGIPPQFQARIFEPFQRGDPTLSVNVPGHGLGLAIARGIAAAHGGSLRLDSSSEAGSTFSVSLPLVAVNGVGPKP